MAFLIFIANQLSQKGTHFNVAMTTQYAIFALIKNFRFPAVWVKDIVL